MEQPRPAAESEELTDSEESVYSGLEDSGSDSTSAEEEEDPEEGPGGSSPPRTHAKGAPRKSKTLEDDSSLKENEGLLTQNEYEEDSSDEE
ncbi:ribosome biogenesis protein BOP1 [Grus japonensis]|uniref:Ribosome biogenesis protein BOP1 n=1 Tax=Grus japonensis TaxID=30415 RepID=A0ABC9W769_GRUJA